MRFIEEIVVNDFLPTIRSMIAESLREHGYTQRRVAMELGISQSAVSKYVHGEVERHPAVESNNRVQELVERIATGLSSGTLSTIEALIEIEVLIRELERGGLLAMLHEQAMPELAGRSDLYAIHDPDSELRTSERVLSSVRNGLHLLQDTRGVTLLIPNVGSNLVECLPNAQGLSEVAGVPGRLFDVRGRLAIPADPEFGASGHVATVLLAARHAGNTANAAMNIRYDPDLITRLKSQNLTAIEFDADYEDVGSAIETALWETPDAAVIYQTGGFGIEPIIYVLAPTAEEVAGRINALVHNG